MYVITAWFELPNEFWYVHDALQDAASGSYIKRLQHIANEQAELLKLIAQGGSPSSRVNAAWVVRPHSSKNADFGAEVVNTYTEYPQNEHLRKGFWGSLATRFEFGYDGSNPKAGYTAPHEMVTGPFDTTAEVFFQRLANEVSSIIFR